MRIPPYWANGSYTGLNDRGREQTFDAFGWSFSSYEAARADGAARARRAFDRVMRREAIDSYGYLDRPLREEIIETLKIKDEVIGIVTRNRYGAVVLNSAAVLFADVDVRDPKPRSLWEAIRWIFKPAQKRELKALAHTETRETIQRWVQSNSRHSLRLYETAAGYRLLFTDGRYDPRGAQTEAIFQSLNCDPMYRRLCHEQECFRARLSPKPWRCGCERPPHRFPWRDAQAEEKTRHWEREYTTRAKQFSVCRLLDVIGGDSQEDEVAAIVDLHDRHTCNASAVSLA